MSHLPNINSGIVGKICPACRHQRTARDRAPRHRCPNCGEAYFISKGLEFSKERLYYDYAKTIHLPKGNEIAFVVNELRVSDDIADNQPSSSQSRRVFFEWMRKTINLGRNEPILILFGVLQYLTIGLFFALWLKGFTFTSTILTSLLMFDIILLVSTWTPLCIYLAALPMSVISACMACVHFLHQQGTRPSIKLCLSIVLPNIKDIWRLQWWDNKAALWRFGSTNLRPDNNTPYNPRLESEHYLFYIWRLGSSGVLAGLLSGRSLEYSARKSVEFVIKNQREVAFIVTALENLRFIIWVLCLMVILGFGITAIYYMNTNNDSALLQTLWSMALVLFGPTLLYQILIKPTYLISLCELHYHHVNGQPAVVPATSNPDTD